MNLRRTDKMDYKQLIFYIKNIAYVFINYRNHKREYEHLENLLKGVKRENKLNKTFVFNTVRGLKPILDREFFLGKILAQNGAKVLMLLDDGILKHWDTLKMKKSFNFSNLGKKKLNLYPRIDLNLKNFFKTYFTKKVLKLALRAYKDKNLFFKILI